ncbi:hypothetical protein HNO88_000330 [Novosphingobium chloroacetimidivorans]|uniref:Uncharacterized protein n=1 Tax=Novosphingobium chloroacetimidivorans TaxID=1428314 RepID=A0A7W7NTZ8_9SPHN|nr:hypothetical protein [Novosphingobium chloroacetimidivorans]MBB4857033.1 hypothetical protein [Novosphingobium chloroacetimidivorans]
MDDLKYRAREDRHKLLIDQTVASFPGVQKAGFWPAMRTLYEELDLEFQKYPFNPDAFKVDRESKTVEIHEAVVTHAPTERCLCCMGWIWFDLDNALWGTKLFLHRYDQVTPAEVDLSYWYTRTLLDDVDDPGADSLEEAAA